MSEASSKPPLHSLRDAEAHVWRVVAAPSLHSVDTLASALSEGEAARAARIRDAAARARFITIRAALRHILARYLGGSAASLDLLTETFGKPVVDPAHGLHFSLTHSRDVTLVAIARTRIGIDVEQIREPRHLERTARRVLHPGTCTLLHTLPAGRRGYTFLLAWTQREAHVKAVGGGLFRTPDSLPFVTGSSDHVLLVRDRHDDSLWSVARFEPDNHATAAVVAAGELRSLRFRSWEPTRIEDLDD